MKKVLLLLLLAVVICSMFAGCTNTGAKEAKPTVIADAAPAQYVSEEAFVSAIKNGGDSNGWDIKSIKYYYRPKNLPEGAILQYVQVRDTYVMFAYTLDTDKDSMDYTKMINFMWYREFNNGKAYIDNCGGVTDWFEGVKTTLYHVDVYETSKDAPPNENSEMKEIWNVSYAQGNICFVANVPCTILKEELAKYLIMEEVTVE